MFTKDGYHKALTSKTGDDAYILLGNGGHKKLTELLESASLGASGNSTTLSITVAGTTKSNSITVPYATVAGSANSVTWANVTSKPSSTGNSTQPVYWNGSTFVACTAYGSASVNYANSAQYIDKGKNKWLITQYDTTSLNGDANACGTIKTLVNSGLRPLCTYEFDDSSLNPSNMHQDQAEYYTLYAKTYILFSDAYTYTASYYADDNSAVYLNGNPINEEIASCTTTTLTLNFKKGWNVIEVIVHEHAGGDGFRFNSSPVGLSTLTNVLRMDCYMQGVTDTYWNRIANDYAINANYATSAGSVTWGNVSSKPDTATRWPAWAEVTSKPSSTGNSTQPIYWNGSTFVACTAYGSATVSNSDMLDGYHYSSFLRKDTNDSTDYQYSFTKTNDHAIQVGTIRGRSVGSQSGEFIHLYERVAIGSPAGWGSRPAPSYGLATYGGAWLATDTGNVGIGCTDPGYKLDVRGHIRATENIIVSTNNTTGGGIILADDGDIVDLNDAYCSMRFTYGVRIFSANRGGSPVITLKNNGIIYSSGFYHNSYGSYDYVLTSDGSAKHWSWWDNYYLRRLRRENSSGSSTNSGTIPPSLLEFKNGYPLHTDPEFASGYNDMSVYDNNGSGATYLTRETSSNCGNSSGYVIKVTSGSGATPGYGGWYFADWCAVNTDMTCIFRALIPEGVSVEWASNSIGSGGTGYWLTEHVGTGKYEWYAYHVKCGTGSESNTFFFYVTTPCTWYISFANTYRNTWANYDGLRSRYSDNSSYSTHSDYTYVEATGTGDWMYPNFTYYGNTYRREYVYTKLRFQPSTGHLLLTNGSIDNCPLNHNDGADRPGISILGSYPQLDLIASVSNSSHGATINIGAYDSAGANSGSFKAFRIGTKGYDATWLDLAYGTYSNPHEGIDNWNPSGNGLQITRFHNDRTIYNYGTVYFGVASYGATYYHSGYTCYSYDNISHYNYTYGRAIIGDSSIWNWTLGVNGNVGISTNDTTEPAKLNFPYNAFAINFRPGGSYTTGFYYGTYGNEYISLLTQQSVTSIIFGNGYNPYSAGAGSFISNDSNSYNYGASTDVIQIKQNCMNIGGIWQHNVTPDYKLKVTGKVLIDDNVTGGGTTNSLLNILYNGTHEYGVVMKIHSYGGDSPGIRFSHSSSASELNSQVNTNWTVGMYYNDYYKFAITQDRGTNGWGTHRLVIDNSGRIGIGTDSPSYTLDIRGTTRSTDRIYSNEWIQFDNWTGLYSPNNNAHFYPNNTTSFGQWQLRGSRNGYSGIHFGDSTHHMTLMDNYTDKGIYQEDQRWILYYNANNGKLSFRTSSDLGADNNFAGSVRTDSTYYGYGLYHLSYGSSAYALTSDGGAAHIGSMSVSYANSAGSASSANKLSITGYQNDGLSFNQTADSFDGNSGWTHYLIANHGDGASYYHYTIGLPFWDVPIYKRQTGSTSSVTQWYKFITEENINNYIPSIPQNIWRYTEISAGDTLTLSGVSGIFYIATCPYWGYGQVGWWDRDGNNHVISNIPSSVGWFNPTYTWQSYANYKITCPDVLYQHSLHFIWAQYPW